MILKHSLLARSFIAVLALQLPWATSAFAANLTGGEGPDTLVGTPSNDTIRARGGNDTVTGGGGNDLVDGGEGNDAITTLSGSDQIFTGMGSSLLNSGDGDDFIAVGTDMPVGEYGTHTYDATRQVDIVEAGAGNDTVFIDNHDVESGAYINGSSGVDRIVIGGSRATYSYPDFENNIWSHIRGFETWYLDGYYGLFDGVWYDRTQFAYNTFPPYLAESGTPNSLTINNTEYPAAVLRNENFDGTMDRRINIFTGRPAVDASLVTDGSISVQTTNYGDDYALKAIGGSGNDELIGGTGAQGDIFKGNGGNDYFDGKDGQDIAIYSGAKADYAITEVTYNSFTIQDLRTGSPDGTDTITDVNKLQFSDQTTDVIIRGLYIVGDNSNEQINGGIESDYIDGSGGNDVINGGSGNDIAIGGNGSDTVVAGEGNDFMYGDPKPTIQAAAAKAARPVKAVDTVDYANAQAAVLIDLKNETASSISAGDPARIGRDRLAGFETIKASSFDDVIVQSPANNTIDGGRGRDAVVFSGKKIEYRVAYNKRTKSYTVTDKIKGRDGTDKLLNVEVLRFSDGDRVSMAVSQPAAAN